MIYATYSGREVDPWELRRSDVAIEDIAHGLAHQCRFGGQIKRHYSVAEHSLLVARILREQCYGPDVQLVGLMHDAAEAYLVDIPSPVKCHLRGYKDAEQRAVGAIWMALDLPVLTSDLHKVIKAADGTALLTEARDLFHTAISDKWLESWQHVEPMPARISRRWIRPITRTKREFLSEFKRLKLARTYTTSR